MAVVLRASSSRLMRFTGVCAGILVALYIVVEAPISGMSMNPARSLGSAVFAGAFAPLWIYFLAPPLGMQLAVLLAPAAARRGCAKLDHPADRPCIFCGQGATPVRPTYRRPLNTTSGSDSRPSSARDGHRGPA
jgi:aquaporin Z